MSDAPLSKPSKPIEASAAKAPRRKGVVDTLVARDQTAVFWFLMACAVGGGCAWYLVIMAEALKARPPFVVMDTSGAYYVAPGLNYDSMDPMHLDLTRLAVETMFQRGPQGLLNEERVSKLFSQNGSKMLYDIINKEIDYFQNQSVEQTLEILPDIELAGLPKEFFPGNGLTPEKNPSVLARLPTAVSSWITGYVTRRSIFNGQAQVENYRFKVSFIWKMNPDMRMYSAYPDVVEKIIEYNLEKISDL